MYMATIEEINEFLDSAEKIKRLFTAQSISKNEVNESSRQEKRIISKLALKELHRLYDHLCRNYDQLRLKTLALLAGEVAIITFIFSSTVYSGGKMIPLLPAENYGKVFYWGGVIIIGLAFILFLSVISKVTWQIPLDLPEVERLHKIHSTEESFLEYIVNDYVGCIKYVLAKNEERQSRFNWGVYALVIGVIILMVIKFRG